MYNIDVNQFYAKYISDLKGSQLSNSAMYDIAPMGALGVGSGNARWADNACFAYGHTEFLIIFYYGEN